MAKDKPVLSCRCSLRRRQRLPTSGWDLGLLVLFCSVLTSEANGNGTVTPNHGDVYIGTMTCGSSQSEIRVFIEKWPTAGRLEAYPASGADQNCKGSWGLDIVWDSTTRGLNMTATEAANTSCASTQFSLQPGRLSQDLRTYSGEATAVGCNQFQAYLQNSWGFAASCPSGYYQYMGATFECGASATNGGGSVHQRLEPNQVTPANFDLPSDITFDSMIISSEAPDASSLNDFSFNVSADQVIADGAQPNYSKGANSHIWTITGSTQVGYQLMFNNMANASYTVKISYTYTNLRCSAAGIPIGCKSLLESEAKYAVQYWSKQATWRNHEIVPPAAVLENHWAVPWYLWRQWWNQSIGVGSKWREMYGQVFRYIDTNNDGYAALREFTAYEENTEPSCPAGYYKGALVTVGCAAFSGKYNFSAYPGTAAAEIVLPAGISDWSYAVSSEVNLDIKMKSASGSSILETTEFSDSGTWSGVSLQYSGNSKFAYVNATGQRTSQTVTLRTYQSTNNIATGQLEFRHGGVVPCPTIPSGCKKYDKPMSAQYVALWAQEMQKKGATASAAWQWVKSQANYLALGWGISEDGWTLLWNALFNPQTVGRRLANLQKQALWMSVEDKMKMAFHYCDTDDDQMVMQSEFTACFEDYLRCPSGYYQHNPILFSCKAKQGFITTIADSTRASYAYMEIPVGARDFTAKLEAVSGSLADGFKFTVPSSQSPSPCNITNSGTHLACPGDTVNGLEAKVQVTLLTPGRELSISQRELQITYSYADRFPLCTDDPHLGCKQYSKTSADTATIAWSTAMNEEFSSLSEAWTKDASLYEVTGLGIPFENWVHVGCRQSMEVNGACNFEDIGLSFYRIDMSLDKYIENDTVPEFAIGYRFAGSHPTSYDGGCFLTSEYSDSDFPLPSPQVNLLACQCNAKLGQGWSPHREKCVANTDTKCSDCPFQSKCAYMSTIVGDGLKDYSGNCHSSDSSECLTARQASLSHPVGIAIDETDNIYIADYGNNRVRMVAGSTGFIKTIAGNGQLGFSGDGGLGTNAMLRHPEGIAVNKVGCSTDAKEVFFSDLLNQRIRKVVQQAGGDWIIHTIVGNGEQGENPACDSADGCEALSATLNNPRAVSLSRAGDLYIADSGNRKIRRLRDGIITTFVGSGIFVGADFQSSLRDKETLLPGHWEENNLDVALQSLYFLKVDREDNLWFVDGVNNRLFMAPLQSNEQKDYMGVVGRYVGYYTMHFMNQDAATNTTLTDIAYNSMKTWLQVENDQKTGVDASAPEEIVNPFKVGKSYWRWALPSTGIWCSARSFNNRARCKIKNAQFTSFNQVMGFCFDRSNEMFIADRLNSEIVKLYTENRLVQPAEAMFSAERKTTQGCKCLSYWVDWQAEGFGAQGPVMLRKILKNGGVQDESAIYEMCSDNPNLERLFEKKDELDRIRFLLPKCTVTNYCKSEAPVPWCFIDTTGLTPNDLCSPKEGRPEWGYCHKEHQPAVEWQEVSDTAIYGYERRTVLKSSHSLTYEGTSYYSIMNTFFDDLKSRIAWDMYNMLTFELPPTGSSVSQAHSDSVPRWSFLLGFVDPSMTKLSDRSVTYLYQEWNSTLMKPVLQNPPDCDTPCCGLQKATASDADGAFEYCKIETQQDFQKASDYLKGVAVLMKQSVPNSDIDPTNFNLFNQRIVFVWRAVEPFGSKESCQEACALNPACKAFMTYPQIEKCVDDSNDENKKYCNGIDYCSSKISGPNKYCGIQTFGEGADAYTCDCTGCGTPGAEDKICLRKPGNYTCLTFTRTDPYEVYYLNEVTRELGNVASPMPMLFSHEILPSDLTNSNNTRLYLNTASGNQVANTLSGYISGPHLKQALLRDDCYQLCRSISSCKSFAFPGCYLMDRSQFGPQLKTFPSGYRTKVYTKVNAGEVVKGVAGLPEVYAFEGNMDPSITDGTTLLDQWDSLAARSLLNRPSSCEVNSKGDVLFVDTWNQRIRKISNLNQACHFQTDLFTPERLRIYMNAIINMSTLCGAAGVLPDGIYQKIETEVVKDRHQTLLQKYLCDDNSLEKYNLQTTNLLVLCSVCQDLVPRSPACPTTSLCACRKAIVDVLTTEVYLNCPAEAAFHDPLHRFVSGYIGCWAVPDTNYVDFTTDTILQESLKNSLTQQTQTS